MSKLKKISIITLVVLLVLWFGGNLGFYLYLKYKVIGPQNIELINKVPQIIEINETNDSSDYFCFTRIEIRLPYNKEDMKDVFPYFSVEYQNIDFKAVSIRIENDLKETISIYSSNEIKNKNDDDDLIGKIIGYTSRSINYMNDIDAELLALNATLHDYSWWNLYGNLKLITLIPLKLIHQDSDYEFYEVRTPLIKGVLTEYDKKDIDIIAYSINFIYKEKDYDLLLQSNYIENDMGLQTMIKIASGIEPINNIDECYKIMTEQYKNNELSKYPEVLLLTSLISLTEPRIDNLAELKALMKKKNYDQRIINLIQEQIDILKSRED